jgi:hypothetical protein
MARAKPPESPKYRFPDHEDDPTLGGAIPAELYHRLQGTEPPADEPADDASS